LIDVEAFSTGRSFTFSANRMMFEGSKIVIVDEKSSIPLSVIVDKVP
jgi:hypothetical protein